MQPSIYQQNVLSYVSDEVGNVIISAKAGSGKTSTLKMICNQVTEADPTTFVMYLAFNNEIAKEVRPKLEPLGVEVKTFHAWGKAALPGSRIPEKKDKYLKQVYAEVNKLDRNFKRYFKPYEIVRVCEILRIWYEPITENQLYAALNHCGIEVESSMPGGYMQDLLKLVKGVVNWGMSNESIIDFVDMLVLPVRNNKALRCPDILLIDESQDLSPIMHKMIAYAVRQGSRVIAVGDENQAIYSFAGADSHSFQKLKILLDAKELPLNVCYRCGDEIVGEAQNYVPSIEGTGKDSVVLRSKRDELLSQVEYGDMIICRTNAPLVATLFSLLGAGFKAQIKGRDYGNYMIQFLTKLEQDGVSIDDWLPALNSTLEAKISICLEKDEQSKAELLEDVQGCFSIIHENNDVFTQWEHLTKCILDMFVPEPDQGLILLSSIHRSKGLEAPRVHYLVSSKGLPKVDGSQESNLGYVGVTRAMEYLNYSFAS